MEVSLSLPYISGREPRKQGTDVNQPPSILHFMPGAEARMAFFVLFLSTSNLSLQAHGY